MSRNPNGIQRSQLWIILFVVLSGMAPGCVSLPRFSELKGLPGFDRRGVEKEDVVYDPAIRAYRRKIVKAGSEEMTGFVLRDTTGKKIQTKEELARMIESMKKESVAGGTKAAAYGLTAVYTPVTFAETILDYVIGFPIRWYMYNKNGKDFQTAEKAYISGRRHFDSQEYEAALRDWEHARNYSSGFYFFSDIDYWRGRAFEAQGEVENARTAFLTFLNYSQRSIPSDFKSKNVYSSDPTWTEKAEDAEKRIYAVQAGL